MLLHMQIALRASLVAAAVPGTHQARFRPSRARELQWLFTNERIAPRSREHVLDGLFGFAERLGIGTRSMRWEIPLPSTALEYAHRAIPDSQTDVDREPMLEPRVAQLGAERYAAVADHAAGGHGMRVLVCGGRSELERRYGEEICARMRQPAVNLVGQDTLLEFLATLSRATAVLTPDSGPGAHGDGGRHPGAGPVCGDQSGALGSVLQPAMVRRPLPARRRARCWAASRSTLPWTTKIERPGVMDLVDRSTTSSSGSTH